jgi:hypothetical protein
MNLRSFGSGHAFARKNKLKINLMTAGGEDHGGLLIIHHDLALHVLDL